MKCLSLWQPWASLLVHGKKRVETRSWSIRHRGPLLIHAANKWNGELRRVCQSEAFAPAIRQCGAKVCTDLPLGGIVGRIEVVDCIATDLVQLDDEVVKRSGRHLLITPMEAAFGDYSPGRFAFLCSNFVAFEKPIPYRGAQGLFDVPANIIPAPEAA